MNKFEEVVVQGIQTVKTEQANCQKACTERHSNLEKELNNMRIDTHELRATLFDPTTGVVTNLKLDFVKYGVITAITSFVGTTMGVLILGYFFSKAVH